MPQALGKCPEIAYNCRAWPWLLPLDRREFEIAVLAMQEHSPAPCAAIVLVDDCGIASLNKRYLGCDGPTNILTFPDEEFGGALFLSLDACAREARIFGQDRRAYFLRLLAHGFGHLPGFEHGPEHAAIESECLEAAGRALSGINGGSLDERG